MYGSDESRGHIFTTAVAILCAVVELFHGRGFWVSRFLDVSGSKNHKSSQFCSAVRLKLDTKESRAISAAGNFGAAIKFIVNFVFVNELNFRLYIRKAHNES